MLTPRVQYGFWNNVIVLTIWPFALAIGLMVFAYIAQVFIRIGGLKAWNRALGRPQTPERPADEPLTRAPGIHKTGHDAS